MPLQTQEPSESCNLLYHMVYSYPKKAYAIPANGLLSRFSGILVVLVALMYIVVVVVLVVAVVGRQASPQGL